MHLNRFSVYFSFLVFFFYNDARAMDTSQKALPENVLLDVGTAIHRGIERILEITPEKEAVLADEHTLREFFVATQLKKFVEEVPEFIQVASIFFLEGGFQKSGSFSFDTLFDALDHGAIRVFSEYLQSIPKIFKPLGLTTPRPDHPEYQFIPTGKPLQANAYGPVNAYGKKHLNQFRVFVTELRLDLLPEDIALRSMDYLKQSLNPMHDRLKDLSCKNNMTFVEAKEYAHLLVHHFLSKNQTAIYLYKYDAELYYILKKAAPEIFNALVFGPQFNHVAIDLRKSGVDKWAGKNFEKGIDIFFDDIGQTHKNGRIDNGKSRWGLLTLDSVQGDLNDEHVKIRQTSIKIPLKNEKDNCCYIEFVTRLPQDMSLQGSERESAPVYEGFHTYNATQIYTSNRSDNALDTKKQDYNDETLKLEIESNLKIARQELQRSIL
ncbi:MAG: VOC family protein [Alphaproteobacteria bacterium]|nr:VOC family protein [Alphaproteobacteria bacterium]